MNTVRNYSTTNMNTVEYGRTHRHSYNTLQNKNNIYGITSATLEKLMAEQRIIRSINLKTKCETREYLKNNICVARCEETEDEEHYIKRWTRFNDDGTHQGPTFLVKTRKDGRNSRTYIRNWFHPTSDQYIRVLSKLIQKYGKLYPFIDFGVVASLMGLAVNQSWYWPNSDEACHLEVRSFNSYYEFAHTDFKFYQNGWKGNPGPSYWTTAR